VAAPGFLLQRSGEATWEEKERVKVFRVFVWFRVSPSFLFFFYPLPP